MLKLPTAIKVRGKYLCPKCERELIQMPEPTIVICMNCNQIYLKPDNEEIPQPAWQK